MALCPASAKSPPESKSRAHWPLLRKTTCPSKNIKKKSNLSFKDNNPLKTWLSRTAIQAEDPSKAWRL